MERRLVEPALLSEAEAGNNDGLNVNSNREPSISDDSSSCDDDKDPTFEVSDSHTSDDIEDSNDSSDSERSDISVQKSVTSRTNVSENSSQDCGQNQLNTSNIGIFNNTASSAADNQFPQDSVRNSVQHEVRDVERLERVCTSNVGIFKKKKTYCKFCKADVTNFERHLERNHKDCREVREMLTFSKKSKERKNIIALIRNEGHFQEYLRGKTRPIYQRKTKSDDRHYPCVHCKGLYLKNFLYRHYKKCPAVKINNDSRKIKHLSASQTLIACTLDTSNTLHKLRVKTEVFSIMKADNISLIAKTDPLIYLFGEQYLKKHKRKQMAVVCSNKMRELARLLIELRQIEKNEKLELVNAIDPSMFDKVIECAKKVGGYDPIEKIFKAPSLSAHLGTSLKQASELLIRLIQRENRDIACNDPEAKLKAAKRFKDLITTQWTTEISSLAFKDLNEKKWNKPVVLPLTKDILKFKDYVTQIANKAVAVLNDNPSNRKEYKNLVNATLTLTILYNRRRIGDVQYTKFNAYLGNFSSSNQEECINSLSSSEKVLTRQYKRIVTGGKGSRPIVILFPQNLQDLMNVLVEIRLKTDLVSQSNEYLFAHPGSDRWVRGDTVIRQFANKCNLDHPKQISSNKLRKQIATVMQILNLNSEETEQFARFMGHTGKTHDEFYKLPQDIYQTAKISKLLILMDKGEGQKYKGKSLDEIDINPEVDVAEPEDSEDDEPLEIDIQPSTSYFMPESPKPSTSASASSCKKSGRTGWTPDQRKVVKNHFKRHIQLKKAPKKQECEELIKKHPDLLKNKDWVRVKTFVYNEYRDKSK